MLYCWCQTTNWLHGSWCQTKWTGGCWNFWKCGIRNKPRQNDLNLLSYKFASTILVFLVVENNQYICCQFFHKLRGKWKWFFALDFLLKIAHCQCNLMKLVVVFLGIGTLLRRRRQWKICVLNIYLLSASGELASTLRLFVRQQVVMYKRRSIHTRLVSALSLTIRATVHTLE